MSEDVTYDQVADSCIDFLRNAGVLSSSERPVPWNHFSSLSEIVHRQFEIPSTTVTAGMRHLLFALAHAARPKHIVFAGSYVGYSLAWLAGNAQAQSADDRPTKILALDTDSDANQVARRNLSLLGHGSRLRIVSEDARETLRRHSSHGNALPIDCLYLDIDDPSTRKRGYREILEAALPKLAPGALILAHDPRVELFADDFENYHQFIQECPRLRGPWVLPIDPCGLSVATVERE